MAEKNIVVLGASFAGLATAHHICKHLLPKLKASGDKYVLHLVDPSTHFWWHIAAPRQICSVDEISLEQSFVPIKDGFKQYGNLQESIVFHQATATALDTHNRTVSLSKPDGSTESLSYWSLIISTGVSTPTPLTGFVGDHTVSQKALRETNTKLKTAKDIVVSGGGPVGVEIAGELGAHFGSKAKVTLVTAGEKLLPVLNETRAKKAETLLKRLNVNVLYNTKVSGTKDLGNGQTEVLLSNGKPLTADVYIPAFGVTPNTEWLPKDLKNDRGFVATNEQTLRVDKAGVRVYSAGDVAGVDTGGVLNMYNSLPVLHANLDHDLLAEAKAGSVAEKTYSFQKKETQFVPVGAKTGVAAFNGWSVPGFVVAFAKGKDYMVSQMSGFTEGKKF
ncbi:Putative FAD/NAD(P)-binding domain, FAD/NAD(P)-binding domain superfamily [Septoria linicola]|uniref:FAD/NAD(P)-binding domain, FAD/NAD(P)-binding domain superfamily n=1 Tax=Septoria linicola TaxID=215465 RepID=A0A9Q9AFH2_9PEZI|nr:Putative FAD/NAD(P)-binding domain, FAD/NAD(P)-binding domain superfamily [Septoria linicola]